MMCCVALRVGYRLCLVRCWLGGFVFAVVNEGRVYRSPFVLRPRLGWASRQHGARGRQVTAMPLCFAANTLTKPNFYWAVRSG
jgi:hypothetical protein